MAKYKFLPIFMLLFVSIPKSEAQFQKTLFRVLAKTLIKSLFDSDDDKGQKVRENNAKTLNPEIDNEQNKRLSHIESQILDINNKLSVHNARITELEEDQLSGNFGLGIGMGNIKGEKYYPMTSIATLNYNEASIGLYLNVHSFDPPQSIKLSRESIKFENILSYARFGSEDGPAYAAFGNINTSSFGNSFLFRNYSNDLIYNDRQVGFKAGISHKFIGAELMTSNLAEDRIKVGRVYCKPLSMIEDDDVITRLSSSQIGFNYIYDKTLTSEEVKIQAFDAQIPIIAQVDDDQHTLVNIFGNYAKANNLGSGYGAGLSAEFLQNGFGIGGFYEYRSLEKNFSTRLFDPFYELGRYERAYSNYEDFKRIAIERQEQSIGIECHLKMFHLSGYYVSSLNNSANSTPVEKGFAHLQALLSIPIPFAEDSNIKIEAAASIDKRNLNDFSDIKLNNLTNTNDFNSIFSLYGSINVPIGDEIDIFSKYQYRDFFQKNDSNNQLSKIKNSVLTIGLSYNFGNN